MPDEEITTETEDDPPQPVDPAQPIDDTSDSDSELDDILDSVEKKRFSLRKVLTALAFILVIGCCVVTLLRPKEKELVPELALSAQVLFQQNIEQILEGETTRLYASDYVVTDEILQEIPIDELIASHAERLQYEAEQIKKADKAGSIESQGSHGGKTQGEEGSVPSEPEPVFPVLDTVLLDQGELSDEGLAVLARLPDLNHLRLRQSPITDDGLESLIQCPDLWTLNLPHCKVTRNGLQHLKQLPKLRQLRLGSSEMTNDSARAIAELTQLRGLHLIGIPITDEGLKELVQLPHLESLYLDDTAITETGWDWLFRNQPQLHVHVNQQHHDRDPKAHSHE